MRYSLTGIFATYRNVRFDSFVKLVERQREDKYKISITVQYNGTGICGDVEIACSAGNSKVRDEFQRIAAETLEIF